MTLNQTIYFAPEVTDLTEFTGSVAGHTEHFQALTAFLLFRACECGFLPPEQECMIPLLSQLAVYHDMGKALLPQSLLNKSGKLSNEEFEVIRTHTVLGDALAEEAMKELAAPVRMAARDICRHHHERWDGGGYPDRMYGGQITPYVHVIGLADAFDALLAHRCYKAPLRPEQAEALILSGVCGAFSPELLEAFEGCADYISQEIYH